VTARIEARPLRLAPAVAVCAAAALAAAAGAVPRALAGWPLAAAALLGAWGVRGLVVRREALVLDDDGLRIDERDVRVAWPQVVGARRAQRGLVPTDVLVLNLHGGGTLEVIVSGLTVSADALHEEVLARAAASPRSGHRSEWAAAARARGLERLGAGRVEDALAALSEAVKLDAKDPENLLARARCWSARGDLEPAEADLTEAIRLGPERAPSYVERARLRLRGERPDLAVEDLTRALELVPGDAALLALRAQALEASGQPERAAADRRAAAGGDGPPPG
jgi:tetratricopeptide (TPR) repeat protein